MLRLAEPFHIRTLPLWFLLWIQDSGTWIRNAGFRIRDSESRILILDSESRIQNAESWIQNPESWILNYELWILDSGFRILVAASVILNSAFRDYHPGFRIQNDECCILHPWIRSLESESECGILNRDPDSCSWIHNSESGSGILIQTFDEQSESESGSWIRIVVLVQDHNQDPDSDPDSDPLLGWSTWCLIVLIDSILCILYTDYNYMWTNISYLVQPRKICLWQIRLGIR